MGRFATLIIGGIIGAGAALLLSPKSGADNRAVVAGKIKAGVDQIPADVQERAAGAVSAIASGSTTAINTVIDNADEAVRTVGSKFAKPEAPVEVPAATPAPSETDDLREKIDAARERIATQVAKNAEAAVDSAVDAIPVAVDAAAGAKSALDETAAALKEKIAAAAHADGE